MMNEEYHSLMANETWDLVLFPKGIRLVKYKWVYKTKYRPYGIIDKHKSKLVSIGFSQVEGIDYTKTFAPISKMNSSHVVLSLIASHKWEVNHSLNSHMGIFKKKSTWNNLLGISKMTLALYATLRNLSMALSKPLGLVF